MDLDEAIRHCKSIGECEVGVIKKIAINMLIDYVLEHLKNEGLQK